MPLGKGLQSLIPPQKIRNIIHEETGVRDRIWNIAPEKIVPNEKQPRKVFGHAELEDLVASIKKHGILQPINVVEKSSGGYELISGERRWRAAQIAGLKTIPAIVRTVTDQEKLELALIENIQRQNLNPLEEAWAYQQLVDEFGLTQEAVADSVGKARSSIANMLRLLGLPEEIQTALGNGTISVGKAKALLSISNPKEQMEMYRSMIGEKMSVRDLEHSVARQGISRKGSVRRDPNLLAQEQILEDRLGSKVTITIKGEQGKISIDFHSKEELKRLMEELC